MPCLYKILCHNKPTQYIYSSPNHNQLLCVNSVAKQQHLNMKKTLTIVLLFTSISAAYAQATYSAKIETGYLNYWYKTITIEPGPAWKGYNLDEEQDGAQVTVFNGVRLANKKLFAGIGLGYLNFKGIHGISVLSDFEYLPMKTKLSPLLNFKLGYDHIWNQYAGGTGSAHTELGIGLNYKLTEKIGLYGKAGLVATQQAFLIPITIGVRY